MATDMIFHIIKGKYRRGEITAMQVWAYVDEGKITDVQAMHICGPRPKGAKGAEGDE